MRINKFVAASSSLSRRAADQAVAQGRVTIEGQVAAVGQEVSANQHVTLDGTPLHIPTEQRTILLNKPVGYIVSRSGQGGRTIYDLLPANLRSLKPIGRLDKNSSGLLLLTNDGHLAHELTHPRFQKTKIYEVRLEKPLEPLHQQVISDIGVQLDDGPSRLGLGKIDEIGNDWEVTMREGRNRQIRRTFAALGYNVVRLHRTNFGSYALTSDIKPGDYRLV